MNAKSFNNIAFEKFDRTANSRMQTHFLTLSLTVVENPCQSINREFKQLITVEEFGGARHLSWRRFTHLDSRAKWQKKTPGRIVFWCVLWSSVLHGGANPFLAPIGKELDVQEAKAKLKFFLV